MAGVLEYVRRHRSGVAIGICGVVAVSCACTRVEPDADRVPVAVAPAVPAEPVATNQGKQAKTAVLPPAKACDGSLAVVTIRVVDAAGAPVNDAVIELKRVKDATVLVRLEKAMGTRGDYPLIDDSALARVAPDGEPFDAEISARGKKTVARLTIGRRPPARCHVALLAGPSIVTLK